MISNCKQPGKIAAKISPQESKKIKDYLFRRITDFCAYFYDEIRYEQWFNLNMVFDYGDYYKQEPLNAVYDYYINLGKCQSDAKVFAQLDLNCFAEEILAESSSVFTKNTEDIKRYMPSYMMRSF